MTRQGISSSELLAYHVEDSINQANGGNTSSTMASMVELVRTTQDIDQEWPFTPTEQVIATLERLNIIGT